MQIAAIFIAVVFFLPLPAFSQTTPSWVNDVWRSTNYPSNGWYVGFSVNDINSSLPIGELHKRVENEAKDKLAQSIFVRVQSNSKLQTQSSETQTDNKSSSTLQQDYEQVINLFTDTEISKVETSIFHDETNKRIYAFAKVKNTDLADYYVSRIEFYLQTATNDFTAAKQFAQSHRRRSAFEKTDEAKKNLEETVRYNQFLSVVDYNGSTQRLLNKKAILQRDIAAFETALRDIAVFITGKETIDKNVANILIPALKNKYSESGCRVTDKKEEAAYILTVNVNNCQMSNNTSNYRRDFVFCYACVEADIFNVRTGKSEAKVNFTGPKAGWTDTNRACQKAFEDAAETLWKEIQTKTELCR